MEIRIIGLVIVSVFFMGCGKDSNLLHNFEPLTVEELDQGSFGEDLPSMGDVDVNIDSAEKALAEADLSLNEFEKASVWEVADAAISNNQSKMDKITDVLGGLTSSVSEIKQRLETQRILLDPNKDSELLGKIDEALSKIDGISGKLNSKIGGLIDKIDMLFAKVNKKIFDLPWYVQLLFAEPIAKIQDFLMEFRNKLVGYITV